MAILSAGVANNLVALREKNKAPILGLQAGLDQMITQADTDAFKAALDKAGVPNEFKTYEGAPHSFFDRAYEDHAAASADAWERVLGFIRKYS